MLLNALPPSLLTQPRNLIICCHNLTVQHCLFTELRCAVTTHASRIPTEMNCRHSIVTTIRIAAVIDATSGSCPLQCAVLQFCPSDPLALGQVGDLATSTMDRVELDTFFTQRAIRLDMAGTEQQMAVPVAIVTMAGIRIDHMELFRIQLEILVTDWTRRMQRRIDGNSVASGQFVGICHREFPPLAIVELTWQRHLDLTGHDCIFPPVVMLNPIPKRGTLLGAATWQAQLSSQHPHLVSVIVLFAGALIHDTHARTVRRCGSCMPFLASLYRFYTKVINRHFYLPPNQSARV